MQSEIVLELNQIYYEFWNLAIAFLLVPFCLPFFPFLKILFIYFCVRERERDWELEHTQAGGGAEGEADTPLSREPDPGLDPRTLGSWPKLKADA